MTLNWSAILGLIVCAACGRGPDQASGGAADTARSGAPTATAALPDSAALAGARALLDSIYVRYGSNQTGDLSGFFTAELTDAFVKLNSDEVGLGYDPFCECQDFENVRYAIQSLEPASAGLQARVSFTNMGTTKTIPVRLALEAGAWKVADVGEGRTSVLAQAANPSPQD